MYVRDIADGISVHYEFFLMCLISSLKLVAAGQINNSVDEWTTFFAFLMFDTFFQRLVLNVTRQLLE